MRRPNLTLLPYPDEDGTSLAKRLHKLMLKEGIYKEAKKRAYYEKPSVKARRKRAESMKRYRKARDASGELKVKVEAEERRFGR